MNGEHWRSVQKKFWPSRCLQAFLTCFGWRRKDKKYVGRFFFWSVFMQVFMMCLLWLPRMAPETFYKSSIMSNMFSSFHYCKADYENKPFLIRLMRHSLDKATCRNCFCASTKTDCLQFHQHFTYEQRFWQLFLRTCNM